MNTFAEKLNTAIKLSKEGKFDEGISLLKESLNLPDLRPEDRMMAHYNLGFFYSKGLLKDPNATDKLTKEEINECATNYSFAKHIYNKFIDDMESKQNLKQFKDGSGWALDHCVFNLNASVGNFKGKWSTGGSVCEDFRSFQDYPPDYYEETESTEQQTSKTKTVKSGCFIATSVYGSYNLYQVVLLRNYRDNHLSNSKIGKGIINLYYKTSPPIAQYIHNKPKTIKILRNLVLNPVIRFISKRKDL